MNELTRITKQLAAFGVEFVVAGGLGSLVHGGAMMTQDVDVVCRLEPINLIRIFEAVQTMAPVHRMTPERLCFTREQAERGGLKNLYLSTTWGQLDCLGEIKGIGSYLECLARSEAIVVDGMKIRVLSLDALIEAKRAMGRPRDLHAVLELEAIRERLAAQ